MGELSLCLQWHIWLQKTLDGRAVTAPTVAHLATENTRLMISGYILTNIVHSVLFHNIKLYWNKVVGKALVSTGDSFANVPGLEDPLMVIF